MVVGALLSVFGLGALLAFFRPVKYGSIVIMLVLMHFMIFLIDVIVLARGQMTWQSILPEMVYFLIMSTALVRWYPLRQKKVEEKPQPEQVEVQIVEDPEESEELKDSEY